MQPTYNPTPPADDPLHPPKTAAPRVGNSPSTLAKRRMDGTGPEYLKIGRKVFYRQSALDAWLDSKRRNNTGEY
jgi:predicted DNA-binding transcriptional regulator AlpA